MMTASDVRFQLRLLGYNGFILKRGEVREMPRLLRDNEVIKKAIFGKYDKGYGMMFATTQRLLFVDRRFFHRHFVDIPYDSVSSVELDEGLFTGCVAIYARIGEVKLRGMSKTRAHDFFRFVDSQIEKHK